MNTKRSKKNIYAIVLFLINILFLLSCTSVANDFKIYYSYQPHKVRDFDPARVHDIYTHSIIANIFETLYQYKYLSDEYEIEPLLASSMPVFSDNNMTVTIKLKDDAYLFDPEKEVFEKGIGRQITAYDFEYSIKRLADPKVNSEGWWLFDGYLVGLNEWRAEAEFTGKADYFKKIEGIIAIDNFTLRFKLVKPYPQIVWAFTMSYTMPVIKEVIEEYGKDWVNHPIGSGPFYLNMEKTIDDKEYVLDKNPFWRKEVFPKIVRESAKKNGFSKYSGKRLPFVDRIIYFIVEDESHLWKNFINGDIDVSIIPNQYYSEVVDTNHMLIKELENKGFILHINPTIDVVYYYFNMNDTFFKNNIKLRQAMSMALNREALIDSYYNGRAIQAQTLIPPGLAGYNPQYVNPYGNYDIEKAKQLLNEAGYPSGKGLPVFQQVSLSVPTDGQLAKIFEKSMAQIGIKIATKFVDWPTYNDLINEGKVQIGSLSWIADYPDAQNFLQLLYGPNRVPGLNTCNYNDAKFNETYEKSSAMLDSPVRSKLYTEAAQYSAEQCPMILLVHRLAYSVHQKWLKNYRFKAIGYGWAKYYDIDMKQRNKFKQK